MTNIIAILYIQGYTKGYNNKFNIFILLLLVFFFFGVMHNFKNNYLYSLQILLYVMYNYK